MEFKEPSPKKPVSISKNVDDKLNFSFLDMQKLAFKKISEVSLQASENDKIDHQEAAQILKKLIDILRITMSDIKPDFSDYEIDESYDIPFKP